MSYDSLLYVHVIFCLQQVIAAEGEHKASRALKDAADVLNESHSALQLRYLQTLSQISAEKNSTIIFPLPIDLLGGLLDQKTLNPSKSPSQSHM